MKATILDYWHNATPVSGDNPYLRRYLALGGDRFDPWALLPGPPGTDLARWRRRARGPLEWRRTLVPKYAWAIPSDEALAVVARYSPLVEIGAGSGYWAHLLQQRGVDILAYDRVAGPAGRLDGATDAGTGYPLRRRWTEVLPGGPEQARRHPERTLLLCWPPVDRPMAARALRLYGGQTVIYIGEWRAATADDRFHDLLDAHWEQIEECPVPQWWGIKDQLLVYRRR